MCWRITSTLTFIVFKVETLFFALPRSQQIWLTKTLSIIRTSLKIGKKCLIQVMSLLFNNDNLNHQPPMQPGSFSSKWTLWKMWFFQLINEIQRMCCSHLSGHNSFGTHIQQVAHFRRLLREWRQIGVGLFFIGVWEVKNINAHQSDWTLSIAGWHGLSRLTHTIFPFETCD